MGTSSALKTGRTQLTPARPHTHNLEANGNSYHGRFIPSSSSHGAIAVLLLQPGSQARHSSPWPFLAAAQQYAGPNVPTASAADAFHTHLLAAKLVGLPDANAAHDVQLGIPSQHDTHGLAASHVPEAGHLDPGALA